MVAVTDKMTAAQINRISVELAVRIWERWHGPLASIPGTHDDTVNQLRQMLVEANEE